MSPDEYGILFTDTNLENDGIEREKPVVNLYRILDEMQSYMDRCENCRAGRDGTCPWLKRFSSSEGIAVCGGGSHRDRARSLHKSAGAPPCEQRTFHQFHSALLKLAGKVRCEDQMPKTEPEVRDFLLRVMQVAEGLEELSDYLKPAYLEAGLYALELAVGALDFYSLEVLHKDRIEVFRSYFPEYNRDAALREFSKDKDYIAECIGKAKKVHLKPGTVVSSVTRNPEMSEVVSTVSTATGALVGLEAELVSERAMTVWKVAQERGWVDELFRWRLNKQEKAMFVGRFSQYIFHEKRAHWQPFLEWDSNCHYSKDFSTAKGLVSVGEANEAVTEISAYFDSIDRIHALS